MKRTLVLLLVLASASPVFGFGTYGEGKAIVYLKSMSSKGIIFESYEGVIEIASFDEDEKCDKPEDCFTPLKEEIRFSVRPESKETVQFLQRNPDRVMVIEYRLHRLKPVALSTSFEVLKAGPLRETQPGDFAWMFVSKKTGSLNYSVYGKILRFEYRGTAVGTYEGIYYDRKADRIVPFSVTDEAMARHVYLCMDSLQEYNMGISRAIVTGMRESKLDIFEINYRESAGGIE